MIFSDRSQNPIGQANPLVVRLEELRRTESGLVDLTSTDPTDWPERRDLERECLFVLGSADANRYCPDPQGLVSTRELVSRLHGASVPASDWFLTASTSEAYSLLFQLLCDPGDHVLVNRPSYPLLDDLARHGGIVLRESPLRWLEGRWQLDIGKLERQLRDGMVKAYCVIQPGNPTGWFLSEEERSKVVSLCARHQVTLISDEVFADFCHVPGFHSLLGESGCLTAVLSGLSKGFGLPGWKLGWIGLSGPSEVVLEARERLQRLNDALLSASTPVQTAMDRLTALRTRLQEPLLERLRSNLSAWNEYSRNDPGALAVPAGWMALLRLEHGEEEDLCLRLMDRKVLVQPGFLFDLPWDGVVVSLMTEPRVFREGMKHLSQVRQLY